MRPFRTSRAADAALAVAPARPGAATTPGPAAIGGGAAEDGNAPEDGSAVVEFVFLAVLLMTPIAYLVLTLGQVQGGAYAVVGAADQAAKVYVSQKDPAAAPTTA